MFFIFIAGACLPSPARPLSPRPHGRRTPVQRPKPKHQTCSLPPPHHHHPPTTTTPVPPVCGLVCVPRPPLPPPKGNRLHCSFPGGINPLMHPLPIRTPSGVSISAPAYLPAPAPAPRPPAPAPAPRPLAPGRGAAPRPPEPRSVPRTLETYAMLTRRPPRKSRITFSFGALGPELVPQRPQGNLTLQFRGGRRVSMACVSNCCL